MELLLAQGNLSTEVAAKTLPTIFTLVSNVQTTVGDGIDIGILKDEHSTLNIQHRIKKQTFNTEQ